jgi:pimeloyl-ACP methyl ester carboxylesterase
MEPLMDELKSDCRVIAPCLRGCGLSSYFKPVKSIKDLAYDIKEFIKEYVDDEEIFLIGHSTGAAVAIRLQIILPWKIKGLILLSPLNPDGLKSDIDVNEMKDVKDNSFKQFISKMAIDRDMDLFRSYIEIFNLPPYTDE